MTSVERERVKKEITVSYQSNGFHLKRDALDLCIELLQNFDKAKRSKWLDKIWATLRKQTLESNILTSDTLRDVFTQISSGGQEKISSLFNVFDSFSLRKFMFDPECKKMIQQKNAPQIVSNVDRATQSFRHRFRLVEQRARRSKQLEKITISTIETLLGSHRRIENVVVIAMLTQQKSDCYHIEDLTGSLQVELSEAEYKSGLFTEGGIFMFEGTYEANLLSVFVGALVPLESATDTRNYFGNDNWFGGEDTIAFHANKKLCAAELNEPEAAIVILSDVFLDKPEVLQSLYQLWHGFAACPPVAFIMCGNFCSKTRQPETMQLLDDGFRRLSAQLNDEMLRTAFVKTNFVFVPGPDDPSLNMISPRPHLPASLFTHIQSLPNISFATNPVRIQYASREIVIFRDDLVEKVCRHTVNKVPQQDISKCFARTILSQAHLSPLPTHVAPVLWDYDYVLSLHPLPDLLIVADKFKNFVEKLSGSIVSNPGSFSRGNFGFHVYYPQQGNIEESGVN